MIVVPHVPGRLCSETGQWARDADAHLHELSMTDDTAYWTALVAWWAETEDLLVVEQDILPHPGVTTEMLLCPHRWCCSPYAIGREINLLTRGLGCTKFSLHLKRQLPDAMTAAGEPSGDGESPRVWWQTDVRLSNVLISRGVTPHIHERSMHLNPSVHGPQDGGPSVDQRPADQVRAGVVFRAHVKTSTQAPASFTSRELRSPWGAQP